ncbi:N-acetylmuramic acid 6-phosphate etherase [Pelagirhabdus alkalitolerans]|uniref:N-acetylmuramic acid 6-phosphate etherase n=1 Tax=Pelagirhabdus alkalitolerans TaxID=1612202 RepID=A0A1G6KX82_9BACI|nr:N-acetylmuramic acid 6-phosphate etherase [Pelagirhabdus alkalitolerans]SDC35709.1 N-acetylmuramic acid 6-phosphate etherase [Pelagirhabdus alkalitolerans]
MINLSSMSTEKQNPNTMNLDQMTYLEALSVMNQEDGNVSQAIELVLPKIEEAVKAIVSAFEQGGRLIYIGAGTSGRLGVLDAAECPPTFGTPKEMVVGLIAGGERAFTEAVEGAEDSKEMGVSDLKSIDLNQKDVVVGLAASGRTPYVIGALEYANEKGAVTVAVSCNKNSAIGAVSQIAIEVAAGPEVLTGSTRLKAGTAQKMVLNMLSTMSMVGIGKVYQNLMVDVQPTNQKLLKRAEHIVIKATDASLEEAQVALEESNGNVKLAITMILLGCDIETAESKLESAKGHIRQTLTN